MKTYAPGALRAALEVALEDKLGGVPLAEFYSAGKRRPQSEAASQTSRPAWSGDHWMPEMPTMPLRKWATSR
jgi:hypothetical protein